ncbi:VOC family protein [Aequorivita sp. F47161]|jgi:PhnB protein|uniref:VOC family protein n=1 Tax=Aequorivita vitellina TaxID=2874475 RepID=A0A9X1QTA8_9FLAO|nr:VOC family protein [Aequorivita vitellina]MCG2419051.1 VOC family protein [Aequorivita vitellina]MCZ4319760.1 VOC family protein [Aequorivita viscosa]
MRIEAYLAFRGNCREAFNFYQEIFGGEIKNTETYENKEIDIPGNYRTKWQHAELRGKDFTLLGYDAAPDTPLTDGTNIHLGVDMDSEEEAKTTFNTLSASGRVHTSFQKTSWGAHYGRCTDKYGISWMINYKK